MLQYRNGLRHKVRLFSLILTGLLGCSLRESLADDFTTTNSQAAGESWTDTIWQMNGTGGGTAPSAGNDYECVFNGFLFGDNTDNTRVRNPTSAGDAIFPGDSLTLNANTELRLKYSSPSHVPLIDFPGVDGNPGLILNGGIVNIGDPASFTILGNIDVTSQSYFNSGDLGGGLPDTSRSINIGGKLSGGGTIVFFQFTTNKVERISGTANTFTGQWIVKAGQLFAAGYGSLGTNSITIDPRYVLPLNGPVVDVAGPAVFEPGYALNSAGELTLTNGGLMKLHENCAFGAVTIEGVSLSSGTHPYAELFAQFPNNFLSGGSGSITVQPYGAPPEIASNVYYVENNSPSASDDNPGTEASPWKTIQHAANVLLPGDTVYIKAGTYHESITVNNSGDAVNGYITYSAYPGQEQQVIIDHGSFNLAQASYIKVNGLKIQYASGIAMYIWGPGSNIVINGNYTYLSGSSGIAVWGLLYGYGSDPALYDWKPIANVIVSSNVIDSAFTNQGYNEQLDIANGVDHFQVFDNILKNGIYSQNGGECIDCKEGASNGKIFGNQIFNNPKYGIYLDAGAADSEYYKLGPGLLTNIEVYNNLIYSNANHGIGITSEGRGNIDGISVYNNVIYRNGADGILLYHFPNTSNYCRNVTIINNTVYDNDTKYKNYGGIQMDHQYAQNVIIRNNIAYANQYGIWNDTTNTSVSIDHNVTGPNWNDVGKGGGVNLIGTDPKFVNEALFDFHLMSNSPAIDYGSSVGAPLFDYDDNARPNGSSWDSGAYEYYPYSPPRPSLQIQFGQNPVILLQGVVGQHYQVQWASSVNPSVWNLLKDIPALPSSPYAVTDSAPILFFNRKFYRAVSP